MRKSILFCISKKSTFSFLTNNTLSFCNSLILSHKYIFIFIQFNQKGLQLIHHFFPHKIKMALPKIFLLFILLQSLEVLSNETITKHQTKAMLIQACQNIQDQSTCLSNLQSRVNRSGRDPNSVLTAALEATLDKARLAIEAVTKFNSLSITSREQIAIEDCKELLDFSVSELAWSVAEMNEIRAGSKNVHYEGNLKAWLSAALSNQDTCLEGFEGTDRRLENFINGSLTQVNNYNDHMISHTYVIQNCFFISL